MTPTPPTLPALRAFAVPLGATPLAGPIQGPAAGPGPAKGGAAASHSTLQCPVAGTVGAVAAAAAAGTPPLALEGLTVRYGRRTAAEDVSLELREGAVYALLGRNGAGKTSLVRCLLGQLRPSAGRALLFGRDVWRHRASLMGSVGVVPEQPDAPPGASARRIAGFCRPLYPRWDAAGFDERLRRFGVPADLPFGRLSKGQQGQVSLALALAGQPRLLILDDPTLGLDAVARRAFFEELIGELADRGTTVFLTTHDLAAAERIAGRVGIVAGGRLLLDEDVERLKHRFRRVWQPAEGAGQAAAAASAATAGAGERALAGLAPLRSERSGWGVATVIAAYDEDRFQAFRRGPSGSAAELTALTLEEIFIALVGGDSGGELQEAKPPAHRPAPPAEGDRP
jgi:ABC-2 type transport system ATP-binding protein